MTRRRDTLKSLLIGGAAAALPGAHAAERVSGQSVGNADLRECKADWSQLARRAVSTLYVSGEGEARVRSVRYSAL